MDYQIGDKVYVSYYGSIRPAVVVGKIGPFYKLNVRFAHGTTMFRRKKNILPERAYNTAREIGL